MAHRGSCSHERCAACHCTFSPSLLTRLASVPCQHTRAVGSVPWTPALCCVPHQSLLCSALKAPAHTATWYHCFSLQRCLSLHLSWSGGVQPLLRFCCVCLTLCTKLVLDWLCHEGLTFCEVCKLISLLGHFCSFYFSSSFALSKFQLISHQKFASLLPYFLSLVLHEPY